MTQKQKTVVVGMSGGVDSSVCAYLLKQQGYRVIGLFMKNWEENDGTDCSARWDYDDVATVCAHLSIPFYSINFVKEYQQQVFDSFLHDYRRGWTPNPDILCNREIKFKVFFEHAMKLGADYLATGHYCRTESGKLLKGIDNRKDQSYFLNAVTGSVLRKVLFPLGELHKTEVREIAQQAGLTTAHKKDSTGICFIGERHFESFLASYIQGARGAFQTLDGEVVGEHRGAMFYTIGQRKHLGLGGAGDAWYVVGKNMQSNIVFVERGHMHPALLTTSVTLSDISWVNDNIAPFNSLRCQAKIRYRQEDQACTLTLLPQGALKVDFDTPQRAAACGQSVAFYQGDVCLGGGFICHVTPNRHVSHTTHADHFREPQLA
ncbi:MAG: tRNA 2-thiouridine(34) synthase MnmA [Zetaproteobacteria bacterium]|nr:tRNA 2-thiouridine(34) synthase MnmA [Zetaproteobacteria bacterium]